MRRLFLLMMILPAAFCSSWAIADETAAPLSSGQPSVEDNLRTIDKDHDGVVTVFEVRAYIESKHGKDYAKTALDDMESSAYGKSCSTPFAQALY